MLIEIDLNLSEETWGFIDAEANRRGVSVQFIVNEILSEVIEDYYREPNKAEILEGIRTGLQEALHGVVQLVR